MVLTLWETTVIICQGKNIGCSALHFLELWCCSLDCLKKIGHSTYVIPLHVLVKEICRCYTVTCCVFLFLFSVSENKSVHCIVQACALNHLFRLQCSLSSRTWPESDCHTSYYHTYKQTSACVCVCVRVLKSITSQRLHKVIYICIYVYHCVICIKTAISYIFISFIGRQNNLTGCH